MTDSIVVFYDSFAATSQATIYSAEGMEEMRVATNLGELADELMGLTYMNKIYSIKLDAPRAVAEKLATLLHDKEIQNYSTNKITVEVI